MKRISTIMVGALIMTGTIKADEGMWTLYDLPQTIYEQMVAEGCSLPYDYLYINDAAVRKAVVNFSGYCTGVVVSANGLVLTNHHCGFEAIRSHSTVEHDYMLNGFYAETLEEELPNERMFVSFMIEQEDITDYLDSLGLQEMMPTEQAVLVDSIENLINKKVREKDSTFYAEIDPFYEGNRYYVTTYQMFSDLRLVFALPKSMGKFGGETDNWMWPRQTCDFSVFRIYANPETNGPAEYSEDNVPYKPEVWAPVSTAGYKEGDFSMVLGYPGSTNRYLSSYGIRERRDAINEQRAQVRGVKQEVMKRHMDADETVRIKYDSKYAQSSNYWKNSIGMNKCIDSTGLIKQKAEFEEKIIAWQEETGYLKGKLDFGLLKRLYDKRLEVVSAMINYGETFRRTNELTSRAQKINNGMELKGPKDKPRKQYVEFEDNSDTWDEALDKEVLGVLLENYRKKVGEKYLPDFYKTIDEEFGGDCQTYSNYVWDNTVLMHSGKKIYVNKKDYLKDPGVKMGLDLTAVKAELEAPLMELSDSIDLLERYLCDAKLRMEEQQPHYSDANFTMRLSYGQVGGYSLGGEPSGYYTTAESIVDKMDKGGDITDYFAEPEMKELLSSDEFGKYEDSETGKMQLCFLTNNDITGGNSGSPMFNGNGELIGLAFDGNWDSLSSDIFFDNKLARTIGVDIRYVLFMMEKWGKAYRLLREIGAEGKEKRQRINLDGEWDFELDRDTTGLEMGFATKKLSDKVKLPGTTDINEKGDTLVDKTVTTHLSRPYSYFGMAWYQKVVNIPESWEGRHVELFLERTKPTTLYVDGKEVGQCDDITVAQSYDLSDYLTPGKHTIALMVDNGYSVPKPLIGSSHAYTEDTQTNWNGIIGDIYLESSDAVERIESLRTQPNPNLRGVEVEITTTGTVEDTAEISVEIALMDGTGEIVSNTYRMGDTGKTTDENGNNVIRLSIDLGDNAKQWNEFHSDLYTMAVTLDGKDKVETTFGLRRFEASGHHFKVNGRETFLRGKHDACVFPLTGHVPMDYYSWHRHLSICKEYGINHLRFHSWCPPEACFEAADDLGIYLQPELPIWGAMDENDDYLLSFLKDEGKKMLEQYGNHPSFVMMGLGNELWGSADVMADFLKEFREADGMGVEDNAYEKGGRRLFTYGTCVFLGYQGYFEPMDYFTTCRNGGEAWGEYNTHTRGSYAFCDAVDGGIINHEYPNTTTNFEGAIKDATIPIISHETGQFQTYPDYDEMEKYTGVLKPYNMEVFKQRLEKAGMAAQAKKFHMASGQWSVELYKADMEMDLRTSNMAGFQLLDIQDYPGQGSAYVGILDAFMEKKGLGEGLVKDTTWRCWCSPVVVLAELPRLTYAEGDTIEWETLVANYGETDDELEGKTIKWAVFNSHNVEMAGGSYELNDVGCGVNRIAKSSVPVKLTEEGKAEHLTLWLAIEGTDHHNSYSLWAYPNVDYDTRKAELTEGIVLADTLDNSLMERLMAGAKVLLMPRKRMYEEQTVGGLVQTDYWNYRMFKTISENNGKPVSPGTLGLLINDMDHPLIGKIPTENRSSWQWAAVAHEARPLVMDCMPEGYEPLIQVVDNVERNHRLGLLFEFSVGDGKLLVCMSDLNETAKYPESRHLMLSILEYMQSDEFEPNEECGAGTIEKLFSLKAGAAEIDQLHNITYHD